MQMVREYMLLLLTMIEMDALEKLQASCESSSSQANQLHGEVKDLTDELCQLNKDRDELITEGNKTKEAISNKMEERNLQTATLQTVTSKFQQLGEEATNANNKKQSVEETRKTKIMNAVRACIHIYFLAICNS